MKESLRLVNAWQNSLTSRNKNLDEQESLSIARVLRWHAQTIKSELTPAGKAWYDDMDAVTLGYAAGYTTTELLDDLHLHNLPPIDYLKNYPSRLGLVAWWMERVAQELEALSD